LKLNPALRVYYSTDMRPPLSSAPAHPGVQTSREVSFLALLASLIIVQLAGSFVYPVARYGLSIIEPYTFAFYRFVISALFLLILVRFKQYPIPIAKKDYFRIMLLGFLIIPFNQTMFLVGQSMTAAGHGAFLFSTTPVFVFVLAIFHLKEKVHWRRAVGTAVALAGICVIMLSGAVHVGTHYLVGDLIILVAVVAWAYYIILGKPLVRKYGALRVTAYALASGTALYVPFGLYKALQYDYSQATPMAWASVLYLALVLSVVVYVLYYWLLKYMDASRLAVYHNTQPVVATIAAWMFLGEGITLTFLIGGAIVLAGVLTSEL
jgi:drug/metabolite transporter (DMT)-like permease